MIPGLEVFAKWGAIAVVVLVLGWGALRVIQKGAVDKIRAKLSGKALKDVEAVNRARNDPDTVERVRDKHRR